jgi:hypothetical protein
MEALLRIPVELSLTLTVDLHKTTLHDLQRDLRREARQELLRGLRAAIAEIEKALLANPVMCTRCRRPMRSRGRTTHRLVTVFGSLDLTRARYRCPNCHAVRRPLDEWMGSLANSEYTAAVCEQALYLAADLSYERAAEVLRHVGGIGISGRQIQRLLRAEKSRIEAALNGRDAGSEAMPRRRFRRAGKTATAGAERLRRLRQLKNSGLWEEYWACRFRDERAAARAMTATQRRAGQSR